MLNLELIFNHTDFSTTLTVPQKLLRIQKKNKPSAKSSIDQSPVRSAGCGFKI